MVVCGPRPCSPAPTARFREPGDDSRTRAALSVTVAVIVHRSPSVTPTGELAPPLPCRALRRLLLPRHVPDGRHGRSPAPIPPKILRFLHRHAPVSFEPSRLPNSRRIPSLLATLTGRASSDVLLPAKGVVGPKSKVRTRASSSHTLGLVSLVPYTASRHFPDAFGVEKSTAKRWERVWIGS